MNIIKKSISDVLVMIPKKYEDNRGFFYESFNHKLFESSVGRQINFVQDNHSKSYQNVLRGLHYQVKQVQGKLIRVTAGEIFDVAVDLRADSPTFCMWTSHVLSAVNRHQIWIPEGFAHGFLVLSDEAEVLYKTTDYYLPNAERCIKWDDLKINIDWPNRSQLLISDKDKLGVSFENAEFFT